MQSCASLATVVFIGVHTLVDSGMHAFRKAQPRKNGTPSHRPAWAFSCTINTDSHLIAIILQYLSNVYQSYIIKNNCTVIKSIQSVNPNHDLMVYELSKGLDYSIQIMVLVALHTFSHQIALQKIFASWNDNLERQIKM